MEYWNIINIAQLNYAYMTWKIAVIPARCYFPNYSAFAYRITLAKLVRMKKKRYELYLIVINE